MKKELEIVEIKIFGRVYPIKTNELEAAELNVASKSLNHQLNQYRIKYAQLDNQDCLSMALIENILNLHREKPNEQVEALLYQRLTKIDDLLSEAIS